MGCSGMRQHETNVVAAVNRCRWFESGPGSQQIQRIAGGASFQLNAGATRGLQDASRLRKTCIEIAPQYFFAPGKCDHARTPIFSPVAIPALIAGAVIVTVVP